MCDNILPFNEVIVDKNDKPDKECIGFIVFSCMTCALKVLLNLTHDNSKCVLSSQSSVKYLFGPWEAVVSSALYGNLLLSSFL